MHKIFEILMQRKDLDINIVNKEGKTVDIKGLTAGDFATVKKKVDFLGVKDLDEITKMLQDEVKVKKSKELKNAVGF